jgi:hypothetical protein
MVPRERLVAEFHPSWCCPRTTLFNRLCTKLAQSQIILHWVDGTNFASLTRNRDGRWRAVELFINSCASLAERRRAKTCEMASHGHFLHVPLLRLSLMLIVILASRSSLCTADRNCNPIYLSCKHFPWSSNTCPLSPFPFVCKFVQPINFLIGFLQVPIFLKVTVPPKIRVIEFILMVTVHNIF